MVVDEAVGSASDSVGTPVVVMVEIDVPAISCDVAVELASALPIVLPLVLGIVLMVGGSDVESATVLKTGFCVPVDAVAYGAIVTVSLKIAQSSATAVMVASNHVSDAHLCLLYDAYCRSRLDCRRSERTHSPSASIDHIHTGNSIHFVRRWYRSRPRCREAFHH